MSGQYRVAWLCEALLVSRSGYYDWKERRRQPGPRQVETIHLRARIQEEFARSRRTYGSPRLARALGCPGRRNRIARLMRAERLFARQRSKYRHATTDSRHGGPIAPNRLPSLVVKRPNQVWVTDATGVLTGQGWLYLVAVLDVCSRRVIGWAMSSILDAPLTIAALRMALRQRRPLRSLIVHSDRGSQFASAAYRQFLAQHALLPSMSRGGNCYDNAFIESFWSSLKYELVYHHRFATHAEARTGIFDYIETADSQTKCNTDDVRREGKKKGLEGGEGWPEGGDEVSATQWRRTERAGRVAVGGTEAGGDRAGAWAPPKHGVARTRAQRRALRRLVSRAARAAASARPALSVAAQQPVWVRAMGGAPNKSPGTCAWSAS